MSGFHCHACGAAVEIDPPIPRSAECASCGRDLRCCKNCRHHDVGHNNQCRESEAEPVPDKQRRNFCEFFEFARRSAPGASGEPRAAAARAKLDALFGGTGTAKRKDARSELDALFDPRKPDPDDS